MTTIPRKVAIAEYVLTHGAKIAQAARQYSVSPSTVRRYMDDYTDGKFDAFTKERDENSGPDPKDPQTMLNACAYLWLKAESLDEQIKQLRQQQRELRQQASDAVQDFPELEGNFQPYSKRVVIRISEHGLDEVIPVDLTPELSD